MDLKQCTTADIIKYAILQLEETPEDLLLHGDPIDQVQAATSSEELSKLLARHYRFDDESDAIDLVMLQFDLKQNQTSPILTQYLLDAFEVPLKPLIGDLVEA